MAPPHKLAGGSWLRPLFKTARGPCRRPPSRATTEKKQHLAAKEVELVGKREPAKDRLRGVGLLWLRRSSGGAFWRSLNYKLCRTPGDSQETPQERTALLLPFSSCGSPGGSCGLPFVTRSPKDTAERAKDHELSPLCLPPIDRRQQLPRSFRRSWPTRGFAWASMGLGASGASCAARRWLTPTLWWLPSTTPSCPSITWSTSSSTTPCTAALTGRSRPSMATW
jgi:hypothetical protein